jgi:hypothetical protein
MTVVKKINPSTREYEDVLLVIEESRGWVTLSDVATISAVSRAKCQVLLIQLVHSGKVFTKGVGTKAVYANHRIVSREKKAPIMNTEFRIAKALFEVHPELLSGKGLRPYIAKPYQTQALAMISRRP